MRRDTVTPAYSFSADPNAARINALSKDTVTPASSFSENPKTASCNALSNDTVTPAFAFQRIRTPPDIMHLARTLWHQLCFSADQNDGRLNGPRKDVTPSYCFSAAPSGARLIGLIKGLRKVTVLNSWCFFSGSDVGRHWRTEQGHPVDLPIFFSGSEHCPTLTGWARTPSWPAGWPSTTPSPKVNIKIHKKIQNINFIDDTINGLDAHNNKNKKQQKAVPVT